jgi:hypothetical protein
MDYTNGGEIINSERVNSMIENEKALIRSEYDNIINIRTKCVGIFSSVN